MNDLPKRRSEKLRTDLLYEGFGVLTIGWDLAIPIVGGVLLGHFLDAGLGTSYTFTLGLLILGVITAYYNLSRVIQRLNRQDRDHAQAGKGEERG